MSYIVLALGGLLAVGGALALVTSYGIIMVERGWAGVIAGTTALAGGVVTFALGLILHRLSNFDAVLKTGTTLPRGSAEDETGALGMGPIPHYVPKAAILPETAPVSGAMPPASGLRSWAQRQGRSAHAPGRNVFKSRGPAAQAALKIGESDSAPPTPSFPPSPSNGNAAAVDPYSEPDSAATIPASTAGKDEGNTPPHPAPFEETYGEAKRTGERDEPWPLQNNGGSKPLIVPPFPEMPIAAGEVHEQSSPRNSWPTEPALIEQILPEAMHIPHEPVVEAKREGTEKSLPEAQEEKNLQQPPHTSKAEPEARPAESETGDEPPLDQAISGDTLAIVGRYESEGASYVMYADGSIEARTDHAVFHFKSMDELKAYMDSQAKKSEE